MSKDTSGPAFPVHDPFIAHQPETFEVARRLAGGMSLRRYIAIKAMQGILASPNDLSIRTLVGQAYAIADEMLAEGGES